jgi:hypothetical protein
MKFFITPLLFCSCFIMCQAQSIIGTWQLVKHTSCMDDAIEVDDGTADMVNEMKSMAGTTRQVLVLRDNNTAEESTKIISRRKSYNSKSFLFKFTGDALYFLDKKSRTIIEGFTVEKFAADSLIISNASRVCETRVFVRIK